jgi:hypothetical protein
MNVDPLEFETFLPVPPSYEQCYEQCVSKPVGRHVDYDYVASPMALAALFDWDEDEDDYDVTSIR